MLMLRTFKINDHQRGFLFRDGDFVEILHPGTHRFFDPLRKLQLDRVSVREPMIVHDQLDLVLKAGPYDDQLRVLDLADHQRALVWVEGRFHGILGPGLSALWTVFHEVEVELVDARTVHFTHQKLTAMLDSHMLGTHEIAHGEVGLYFLDGVFVETLRPGTHAFWQGLGTVRVRKIDIREQRLDVGGQEIMTADKVTLRLNSGVTFKVADPLKALTETGDFEQALYRDAQLALRAGIGARELDQLLAEKTALADELAGALAGHAAAYGVEIVRVGIRDVILPGEMKDLMNQVIEARKAAEAALVTRREETAAMRSQANTARILEANPTLMRLRELEVLEKVAEHGKLNLVVGEKGLTDRVMNLL